MRKLHTIFSQNTELLIFWIQLHKLILLVAFNPSAALYWASIIKKSGRYIPYSYAHVLHNYTIPTPFIFQHYFHSHYRLLGLESTLQLPLPLPQCATIT